MSENDKLNIYDLSIHEKDFEESNDGIKEFDYIYNIFELTKILKENNNNTDNHEFQELSDKINLNIEMAQMVDYDLHPELEITIRDIKHPEKLAVLWKNSFENAKVGDTINGGIVVGVFTLTIWIIIDDNIDHKYCITCNS